MRYGMAGRRMERWGAPRACDADGQDSERYENDDDAAKAVMGHAHDPCSCSNGDLHNNAPDVVSGRLGKVHETVILVVRTAV
jgi:hypothetical protein